MGLFDTVVVLDPRLECPDGHPLGELQNKELDEPSMQTWLVQEGRLWRVERADGSGTWEVRGDHAIRSDRHPAHPEDRPRTFVAYTHCASCEPVLVRCEAGAATLFGDLVREHALWVEF